MKQIGLTMALMLGMLSGWRAEGQAVCDTVGLRREAKMVWEMPAAATVWGVGTLSGVTTLWWEPTKRVNLLVREESQLWRREACGLRAMEVDNYLQLVPLAGLVVLKAAGLESEHGLWELTAMGAEAFVMQALIVQGLKRTVTEWRPDRGSSASFPSGHTATAFCGAELMRLEYGRESGWIGAAGYAVALATGLLRIYNDRHWAGDVLAGAGIGVLTADLTWWVNKQLEKRKKR